MPHHIASPQRGLSLSRFFRRFGFAALLAVTPLAPAAENAPLATYALACDGATGPLGIDSAPPRLSWKLRSDERRQRQTGWQILVASSPALLAQDKGDLWDSGRQKSDAQLQVPYGGQPLHSSQQVFWKVRAFDAQGKISSWSEPATWTMGLLAKEDWKAHWITAAEPLAESGTLLLRREFTVKAGLRRAVIHVTGLGAYELLLNGTRVGADLFSPGWSTYEKTCFYDTFDVTALLQSGANAAGIFLGNGMYSVPKTPGRYAKFNRPYRPPLAIAHLRLEYADGTGETVGTDASWRTHPGPITFSNVYGGEDHDARLEMSGWARAGFDDGTWAVAAPAEGPGGELRGTSHAAPPVRAHETLAAVKVTEIRPGVAVYDFGQNTAIVPRLRVRGAPGGEVKLIPAEVLRGDGTVDRVSVGRGNAWWKYTLAGREQSEEWFPRFYYHGCRYLQVERTAPEGGELPVVEKLEACVVHSSSPPAGDFACSDALFENIRTLVRWAQRSNTMTVLTDCPHRERLGWLEQYHLNGPALRYEHDLSRLFAKTFGDMADAQTADGLVPDTAPEYTVLPGGFRDSPEWGSAFILAAWQQYVWTGDDAALRRHFDAMQRYVEYLGTKAKAHLAAYGLGDWYDIGPKRPGTSQLTPIALTATGFYFADVKTLAAIARVLNRADDAARLEKLAEEIKGAFNQEFFHADVGSYATGSQTANALPLVLDLVPAAERSRVLEAVVQDVRGRGNAITAGDVGYRYLLRALADGGRSEVIFDLNHQSEKPGYGYQLAHGATSLTEAWDAGRTSSQNHFMLGQITEWFYHDLAGLAPDPATPGFKNVIVRPRPVTGIDWARASYDSVRGKIAVSWKKELKRFTLEIEIPPNATATVHVPVTGPATAVHEGNMLAEKAPGVRRLSSDEPGTAVFAVESGRYEFSTDGASASPPASPIP